MRQGPDDSSGRGSATAGGGTSSSHDFLREARAQAQVCVTACLIYYALKHNTMLVWVFDYIIKGVVFLLMRALSHCEAQTGVKPFSVTVIHFIFQDT